MQRGRIQRVEYAAVFLIAGSVGFAQNPRSLPDAPSAVFMHQRMYHSGPSKQAMQEVRVRKFMPDTEVGVLNFQAEPLVPHGDAERLSAIGHTLMPALPMTNETGNAPSSQSPDTLGRATHALTRVLLGHDPQGHTQANGAYLLGAMVTSFLSTAHQPYAHHPPTEVLGNFGSTVGGAAGMNLFNEFWPQLKKGLTSHVPRVLQRRADMFK